MSDLYLIAHKVRGEAAFDVATRCECPECLALGCHECDGLGYWWIIPTSGHRAYPWWDCSLEFLGIIEDQWNVQTRAGSMPPSLPDHYPTRAAPTISLTEVLGLAKPKPQPPIVRRL